MSGGTQSIVARSRLVRKCAYLLERGRVEAFGRKPPERLRPGATPREPFAHSFALGREAGEGRLDVLGCEAFLLERVLDGGVAEAAAGKAGGPAQRDAAVIDEACPLEGRKGLGA